MRKILSVLLSSLLFLGVVPFPLAAGTALAVFDLPARQISFSSASQECPAVSGDKIVWQDWRNGNWDVYLYDRSTYLETRITTDTAQQGYPVISSDAIAWQDHRKGNADIYAYDLATKKERQITSDAADQGYPAISGSKIVWQDHRNGNPDIYLYDLSTGKERRITNSLASQCRPAISGNKIVWEDYRSGNADIFLYDLSTNKEKRITSDTKDQKQPAISGNRIVWTDFRNGNADIYCYDLSTNQERRITLDSADQEMPKISGNKIVWQDHRNGNFDIYRYDLSTNQENLVAKNSSNQMLPSISGDKIVWEDYRNGNSKIFLSEPPSWLPDTEAPSAPADLAVVRSGNSLKLSWTASEDNVGVVGYKIERSTDPSGSFKQVTTCEKESFTDTTTATSTFSPNTRYYYQVRAVDARGNTSTYSNMANGIVDTQAPTNPAGLAATRLGGSLILTWGSSSDTVGVSGYALERTRDQVNWKTVGTTDSYNRSFTDGNLASDTQYYYRVKAFDGQANYSGASNIRPARSLVQTSATLEDSNLYFKWSGPNWFVGKNAAYSGGSVRCAGKNGNAVEVVFRGTSVTWLGTMAADKGIAKVYIDGVLVKTVDEYAATAAAKQSIFTASGLTDTAHTLRIEATGTKRPASSGTVIQIDAVKIGGYSPGINIDQAALTNWKGSWSSSAGPFYSGGSISTSAVANDSVELAFVGTSVSWIGTKGPNRGIATVFIDGVPQGSVNQYAAANAYQQALFSKSGLSNNVHRIKIVVTATKKAEATGKNIDIDCFSVR